MSKIDKNKLVNDEIMYISGKVEFSRLLKPYEGAELEKLDRDRVANGKYPVGKPYTTITIKNVTIDYKNPQNPSILEQYVQERCYQSKKDPSCWCYGINNKSGTPVFGHYDAATKQVNEIVLEGELAKDSQVSLMLKSFTGKSGKGVGLECVIIMDPVIQYFNMNGGNINAALSERGITWNAMNPDEKRQKQQAVESATTAVPAQPQPQQPAQAPMASPSAPTPEEASMIAAAQQYTAQQYPNNAYTQPYPANGYAQPQQPPQPSYQNTGYMPSQQQPYPVNDPNGYQESPYNGYPQMP